ncbi:hypothetical protein [Runella limosa]|uniref:hypothetical protein n=1 Tax=Runella limosa TaxID=370978 RepID=UPI0004012E3E|nr:hypothetical protein [Runella limosa]
MSLLGFIKLPNLCNLKGKEATNLTAEELSQVVAELSANGLGGIAQALQDVGQASAVNTEAETLRTQLAAETGKVTTLTTELNAEKAKIATLQTQLTASQAEVARLSKLPGAEPTTPITTITSEGGGGGAENPFWSQVDEDIKQAKAQMAASKL